MDNPNYVLAVAPARAATLLGLSKTRLYELLGSEIPFRKCGRRTLIAITDLEHWLRKQPTQIQACKEPAEVSLRATQPKFKTV
jgi:excisionase family DNA binding protein